MFCHKQCYPTYCRVDPLAIGVGIGALLQCSPKKWDQLKQFGNIFLGLGILIGTLSYWITRDEYTVVASCSGYLLNGVSFGFLVLAALSPSGLFSKFKGRWATVIANLAFSFYLTHKAIIHHSSTWLNHLGIDQGSILYPLFILTICTLSSALLYLIVEKPFLKFRDRLLHKKSFHYSA